MALLAALIFLFLGIGGCATESSGGGEEAAAPRPPHIVLTSAAGAQQAVLGSYCVTGDGTGICTDSARPVPKRVSVVRPGEEVVVELEGARVVEGEVTVRRLGCIGEDVDVFRLDPGTGTRWSAALAPGAYQLDVFARFEGEDVSGDVSGSLGLFVDDSRPLEIVRAARSLFVCSEG